MTRWTAADMPNLEGKVFVVTGANSGLGLETTRALAAKGARVVMACRSEKKVREAMEAVRSDRVEAKLDFIPLDLASLASIESFASECVDKHPELHGLINNAGVMALPEQRTAEGFEMQIGTNHLGHFALTGRLLASLRAVPGARITTVSSIAHRIGKIRFDDINWNDNYNKWAAYGQSKLANLLFTFELQRRLERAGAECCAVAAHPGYSATNLQFAGPRLEGSRIMEKLSALGNRVIAQTAAEGALPQLYAATAEDVRGGEYFGPDGPMEMTGYPERVGASARARSEADAARLWRVSEELTGVPYDL